MQGNDLFGAAVEAFEKSNHEIDREEFRENLVSARVSQRIEDTMLMVVTMASLNMDEDWINELLSEFWDIDDPRIAEMFINQGVMVEGAYRRLKNHMINHWMTKEELSVYENTHDVLEKLDNITDLNRMSIDDLIVELER